VNIEPYMPAISDAARIVKAALPPGHGLELADLVQIGVERILRYGPASPVLAFVCAKQGMQLEVQRWRAGRQARRFRPEFVEYQDNWDDFVWRRSTALDLELLIDLKRALLAMQLREAVAWYSHHWLGEELGHLEPELGVTEGRIQQYVAAARDKLKAAWRGASFETEEDRATRERARVAARDVARAAATEKMLAERRSRYAQLRAMGASSAEATVGGRSRVQFLAATRRLASEGAV
jgi:hypothetical protein